MQVMPSTSSSHGTLLSSSLPIAEQGVGGRSGVGPTLQHLGYADIGSFPERAPFSQVPPTTFRNVRHLLAKRGVTARFNVISKKIELVVPGLVASLENADSSSITHVVSMFAALGMSTGRVPELVAAVADEHRFNPAVEWIMSKEWDGKDRLPELYATLTVRADFPTELRDRVLYHWLLSATAAALSTSEFKTRGVLTLQGPQSIGKSTWLRSLVSEPMLQRKLVLSEHLLDPRDKDSVLTGISHWIVELGELEASFKSDIGRLKAFITRPHDRIRPPYGRSDHSYPRRTVFCASVNQDQFLVDPTGNSRWLTLPVVTINAHHNIEMQQVFAQLAVDFFAGGEWWLSKSDEQWLESFNKQHATKGVISERLRDAIDHDRRPSERDAYMGTVQVLQVIGIPSPTNAQSKEVAHVLRELYGEPKRINGNMKWRVCWLPDIELPKIHNSEESRF